MLERYIIRSEVSCEVSTRKIPVSPDDNIYIPLMQALYDYKDVVDYDSWLYIVTSTHANTPKQTLNPIDNAITTSYTISSVNAKRYVDATNGSMSSTYMSNQPNITIPRAVLLFDKNNTCRFIEVSDKLKAQLMKSVVKDSYFVNLGRMIYNIDASFSATENKLKLNGNGIIPSLPIDLLPFISKNIPDVSNWNNYDNTVPEHLTNFIERNFNMITKDLLIERPIIEYPTITYVSIKSINDKARKDRIAMLRDELRQLEGGETTI